MKKGSDFVVSMYMFEKLLYKSESINAYNFPMVSECEFMNMEIKATIAIDDDRWAKHPYGVKFDDPECDSKYGKNGLDGRDDCYRIIEGARNAGYNIESDVDEYFY